MSKTEEVIEYLKGTCHSLDIGCAVCGVELDDLDYEKLDSEIFCCDDCNWWCTLDEASYRDESLCSDCYEDE